MPAEIALVHLVWKPAGIRPLKDFRDAYQAWPAGAEHELIVVYNGFAGGDVDDHRRALAGMAHTEMTLPARVLDIAAYQWVAQRVDHPFICFVNSYSRPLAPGWLQTLRRAAAGARTGAVGASGSWESLYTNYALALQHVRRDAMPLQVVKDLVRRFRLARYRRHFDPVPNPHLRSNAFLIERARWLALDIPRIRRKWQAWEFESGRRSLTRQLLAQGFQVFVVGRDGVAYGKDDWPKSHTFRSGDQSNLLVGDNRTQQYEEADEEERRRLRVLAWGSGTEVV